MKQRADSGLNQAVNFALSDLGGSLLILDEQLRVQAYSQELCDILGFAPPIGAPAPKLLCGEASYRPIAESLEAGKPIRAVIKHPATKASDAWLRVVASPVWRKEKVKAWILSIEPSLDADAPNPVDFQGILTCNPQMKRLTHLIRRAAESDATILVRGETGSGKELVARAIHDLSDRASGPFRAINCAALPSNLLESELFGHLRGAFTGAVKDTVGHLQLAHRGTLFLDEVAEMPPELQAKLLRVLETHSFIPVGARDPIPVDVRIVSATHRALRKEVEAGRFRADLMYRLRVIPIFIPPLRDRPDDIEILAMHFVADLNQKKKRKRTVLRIAQAALTVMRRYDWPGNVRELRNVIAYAFAMGDSETILAQDLPSELVAMTPEDVVVPSIVHQDLEHLSGEGRRIAEVLRRVSGSRDRAAKILGISRITLWRRMKEYGLIEE